MNSFSSLKKGRQAIVMWSDALIRSNQSENIPYVFISWTRAQFEVERQGPNGTRVPGNDRMADLHWAALKAAAEYYSRKTPHQSVSGMAYWLSQGCLSAENTIDENGDVVPLYVTEADGTKKTLERSDPRFAKLRREEANKDVSPNIQPTELLS
jgi:hypothetical protein